MLDKLLTSRWCPWIAALVGMLLIAPGMNLGLTGDDYMHWSLLTGQSVNPQPASFWGIFTFADGNPVKNQALIDAGKLVWWSSPDLRIAFWRPLAELSQGLDYRLWPDSPLLMHLHSLLLYGLMTVLVGKLFLALDQDRKSAGLGMLLFAGNMLHVFAVTWLASRNQMLCGVFLVGTLLAYHRWRSAGSAWQGVLAAALLTLGLFSAEAAVQTAGYLFAYAVCMETGRPWWRRLVALLPFALIVLAWKALHGHLGYGSFGSPGYIDPSANTSGFLSTFYLRMPALMLAQWFGVSSVMFEQLSRETQHLYAGTAAALLALLAAAVVKVGGFTSPLARFYVLGAVLSLVPACAGYPFDRLTVNANIGVSGLLGMVSLEVWRQRRQLTGGLTAAAKYFVLLVGGIHLILFPLGTLAQSALMKPLIESGEKFVALGMPEANPHATEHFLLVNVPSAESVYYIPLTRQYHGMHNPTTLRVLGPNHKAMTLTRVSDVALRITVPSGFRGSIVRDLRLQPFRVGDTAHMGDISVTVEEVTEDHAPKTALFRFPDSLDSSHWRLLVWGEQGVKVTPPPAVGASLELAEYDLSKAMMK